MQTIFDETLYFIVKSNERVILIVHRLIGNVSNFKIAPLEKKGDKHTCCFSFDRQVNKSIDFLIYYKQSFFVLQISYTIYDANNPIINR